MNYLCGYEAVNKDHCWVRGKCVVCGKEMNPNIGGNKK